MNEKIEMVKWFYGGNSSRQVSDMFSVKYPERTIPNHTTINRIVEKFETAGTLIEHCKCNNEIARPAQEDETVFNVLASVTENPRLSLRQIAENLGVHHTTVLRILKRNQFRSYKFQRHQELVEGDMMTRNEFCNIIMEKANEDRNFLKDICFTDECTFTLHNEPNVQNNRMWYKENPRKLITTKTQYPVKVNVWAGIQGPHIIGPFFLDGNLTGESFLQLLLDQISPAITEVARENQQIWFQMDGCPAHNSRIVREFLTDSFDGNIIGPNYNIQWPPRSPDLSPNDFYLWGYLKSKIYNGIPFNNAEELKNAIRAECERITCHQLANVRRQFYDRLGYCQAVDGNLFEHLL